MLAQGESSSKKKKKKRKEKKKAIQLAVISDRTLSSMKNSSELPGSIAVECQQLESTVTK